MGFLNGFWNVIDIPIIYDEKNILIPRYSRDQIKLGLE